VIPVGQNYKIKFIILTTKDTKNFHEGHEKYSQRTLRIFTKDTKNIHKGHEEFSRRTQVFNY